MKFETTLYTDSRGNNTYGVIVSSFPTEREAKAFAKALRQLVIDHVKDHIKKYALNKEK